MKNIRNGIDFLTKSSHFNYKLLSVRLASSSSKPNADVESIREKQDNVSNEMLKPYAESEKCVKTSYHTRGVYTKRSVAKWLNDKDSGEDWSSKWTAPRTFHASRVPIDIRMGPAQNMVPKPDKYGNLELVKVQNFLHLTPPSVKNHCQQLKKFCTVWPEELATDADCEREFPLDIHTADYVRASQTQADNRARIVTAQVRLCNTVLNRRARDKIIKLCGARYNRDTDILTLTSDRCPFRHQNRQYIQYLLTVLYFESWKTENWECYEYASDEDSIYEWEKSNSYQAVLRAFRQESASSEEDDVKIAETKEMKNYRDAVSKIKLSYTDSTRDEREKTMLQYKESVLNLMNLPHL